MWSALNRFPRYVRLPTTALLPTQSSWQVEWTESVYARSGQRKQRVQMRALVQVYQSNAEHVSEDAVRTNPLKMLNPGSHELKIYALDPGVMIDRIEVDLDGATKHYGALAEN